MTEIASITDEEFLYCCPDGAALLPLLAHARAIVEKTGGWIARTEFDGRSVIEYPPDAAPRIRWFIGFTKSQRTPFPVIVPAGRAIAALLHELGHLAQPRIAVDDPCTELGSDEQLAREIDAWDRGWKIVTVHGWG